MLLRPERRALTISTKETDHGQENQEDRRRKDRGEGQGQAPQGSIRRQGPRKMNYTLTQAIDRAKDLSGIIKAARSHEADCAADHEAKKNIAEIAGEAHEKAVGACIALETEREALADHIAALVRRVGDPLELPEPASPFWHGNVEGADFQAQALQNGIDRVGEALDASRT